MSSTTTAASDIHRVALATELAATRAELRRERALRAHPVLADHDLISLVRGDTDDAYAENAAHVAQAITAALSRV
ncbi:hypothetical protein [Microbacterium gorillae]|uniref:hypothetical protein n=1 Tax=Microbacterium gorillae TaxID=1231063 RepID=UPI000590A7A2|nr:hypothetical protein [Microbacterium gorillae]